MNHTSKAAGHSNSLHQLVFCLNCLCWWIFCWTFFKVIPGTPIPVGPTHHGGLLSIFFCIKLMKFQSIPRTTMVCWGRASKRHFQWMAFPHMAPGLEIAKRLSPCTSTRPCVTGPPMDSVYHSVHSVRSRSGSVQPQCNRNCSVSLFWVWEREQHHIVHSYNYQRI